MVGGVESTAGNKIMMINMKKLLHPSVVLWLLFSLICAFIVGRSQFTADMSAFLPRDPSPRQQILIDQIGEGFASRALIVGIEGAPVKILTQLSLLMGNQLREGTDFSSISNGQSNTSKADQELLFANRYLLSPAMSHARMSVEGLRAAMTDSLAEVASATGLLSKSLLGRDPTGESLEVLKRIIPANQPSQAGGVWMNAAQTRALLFLQTRAQGSDLDAQEAAHAAVVQSFSQAQVRLGTEASQAKLKFSGPSVFAVSARDAIKTEAARLSTLGTIMVLGLLWLIYRSVTTLFLGMIPVLTGAVAGIAAVGLGFTSVHGMTLGFGITLIGEAVDYAIYLFVQYTPTSRANHESKGRHAHAFASSFWPTIRLGVLTSIFGFSTLLLSGFTGLAQLGLFSIVGIVVAATATRFVLPVLLPENFSVRQPRQLGDFLATTAQNLGRLKWIAIVVALMATLVLVVRWSTLWSVELGGLSPVSGVAQKLDTELRADMGAPDAGMLIVLKANSSERALQLSEEVSARLEILVSKGELGGYQAASNYLPSQKTQLARKASLPDEAELRQRTAQALDGLPLKPDKLAEFFTDVANAKNSPPVTRVNLEGTSLSLGVDSLLMQSVKSPNQWTALIALQAPAQNGSIQTLNASAISDALMGVGDVDQAGVYVVELKTEAGNLYKAYLREAIVLTAAGFLAIIVLLSVSLRSVRRVVRVVMPLLASVVIVAAGVAMFKGSLSLLHLVGLLLVIAIGSNYALFFDQRSRTSVSTSSSGGDHNMLCSLFFANLTTVLGFGLLAFSSVPVMNAIGLTVGSGTFLALVLSAVFAIQPHSVSDVAS
jgi:predicted exporter